MSIQLCRAARVTRATLIFVLFALPCANAQVGAQISKQAGAQLGSQVGPAGVPAQAPTQALTQALKQTRALGTGSGSSTTLRSLVLKAGPRDLAKLVPNDSAPFDNFGNDIDIDGDVILVGASTKRINGSNYAGAAYVYRSVNGQWLEEQELRAPAPEIHDNFGTSVDVQGDLAVIGAPDFPYSSFSGTGRVWIFRRVQGTWAIEAELHGSGAGWDSGFGRSVALDGDTIIVGAFSAGGRGAYVFEFNGTTWNETQRFIAPGTGLFGSAVALAGDVALVADRYEAFGTVLNAGAVHVYHRDNGVWTEEAVLSESPPQDAAYFGAPLEFDGDVAAIGSRGSGEVRLFRRGPTGWAMEQRLKDPFPTSHSSFPSGMAVEGDRLLVGVHGLDVGASGSGAALLYRRSGATWYAEGPFLPRDSQAGQSFGSALALQGDLAAVGSLATSVNAANGAAYLFDVTDRALGFHMEVGHIPLQVDEDLDIRVRGGFPSSPVYLFSSLAGYGQTMLSNPWTTLSIAAPTLVGTLTTNSSGTAQWQLGTVPASVVGLTFWYQAAQEFRVTAPFASTVAP
ncbi:MAG: hypothetical protein R3F49_21405 [Planctomycetota bacterium]